MKRKHYWNSAPTHVEVLADTSGYDLLFYNVGDGDPADPATTVEQRLAVFKQGQIPSDVPATIAESSRRWGFEGLANAKGGAILDEPLAVLQEADEDVLQHRSADERIRDNGSLPWSWRQGSDGVTYDQFMEAIDRVAEDDSDEAAWTTIDKWRQRQLQEEDKAPK